MRVVDWQMEIISNFCQFDKRERGAVMVKELSKPKGEKKPEKVVETISGMPLKAVYTADDLKDWSYERDLADPGQFPYTRGIHHNMYLGKLWTMRQFAGYGGPEETNARFKYLLSQGQTGLSTAFDLPTLMGYDSDHPKSHGEVGVCGVAVDSLKDVELLYRDIPLDQIS